MLVAYGQVEFPEVDARGAGLGSFFRPCPWAGVAWEHGTCDIGYGIWDDSLVA